MMVSAREVWSIRIEASWSVVELIGWRSKVDAEFLMVNVGRWKKRALDTLDTEGIASTFWINDFGHRR